MADFNIRPASDADYTALCRLIEVGDAHHRTTLPEIFRAPDGPVRDREHICRIVSDPESAVLVATDGDGLVGFIHVKIARAPELPIMVSREFAVIDNLVVAQGCRHKGLGTALIRAAENWANCKGLREVELDVWEFNSPARDLYEFLQYQTITRRMRKRLNPPAPNPDSPPESN